MTYELVFELLKPTTGVAPLIARVDTAKQAWVLVQSLDPREERVTINGGEMSEPELKMHAENTCGWDPERRDS